MQRITVAIHDNRILHAAYGHENSAIINYSLHTKHEKTKSSREQNSGGWDEMQDNRLVDYNDNHSHGSEETEKENSRHEIFQKFHDVFRAVQSK